MLLYRVSSFTQTYLIVWQSMTTSWHAEMTMWHDLISAIMDDAYWHSRTLSVTHHEIWQCHYMASWHDMAHMSGLGWDSWLDMPLRNDIRRALLAEPCDLWHATRCYCHVMSYYDMTRKNTHDKLCHSLWRWLPLIVRFMQRPNKLTLVMLGHARNVWTWTDHFEAHHFHSIEDQPSGQWKFSPFGTIIMNFWLILNFFSQNTNLVVVQALDSAPIFDCVFTNKHIRHIEVC